MFFVGGSTDGFYVYVCFYHCKHGGDNSDTFTDLCSSLSPRFCEQAPQLPANIYKPDILAYFILHQQVTLSTLPFYLLLLV